MAEAVDGGGVDPVDAQFECGVDGGDRILVILAAPAELPVTAAERPRAEADGGDVQVRFAKGACVHGRGIACVEPSGRANEKLRERSTVSYPLQLAVSLAEQILVCTDLTPERAWQFYTAV